MTQKEFLDKLQEYEINVQEISAGRSNMFITPRKKVKKKESNLNEFCIYNIWTTGSYYGQGVASGMGGEDPPEFDSLDDVISKFCPDISYKVYKELRTIIKYNSWEEHGYYEECQFYCKQYIVLMDLYNKLVELSLI